MCEIESHLGESGDERKRLVSISRDRDHNVIGNTMFQISQGSERRGSSVRVQRGRGSVFVSPSCWSKRSPVGRTKKKQLLFTEDKLADNEVSCGGKSGLVGSMLLKSVQRRCHAALNQLSHRTMQALYHSVAPDLSNFYGPLKS